MTRAHLFIAGVAAATTLAMTVTTEDRFPDGAGKAEFLKVCSGCHEAENVFAFSKTADEWSGTLANMAQLGAEATQDEWRLIERYIHAQLALIKINTAARDELQRTFAVEDAVADAIVKYRQEHGNFKSPDDVKKVPGLEPAAVDARRERLIF